MNEFQIINKYFSSLSIRNKGSYNLKNDIFFDFKKKIAVSIDTYVEKNAEKFSFAQLADDSIIKFKNIK